MKFGFVDEHRHIWPIRVMCTVLGLSVSGYYTRRSRGESPRAATNRVLIEDIRRIHGQSSGTCGSPRTHAALRCRGRRIGRSRIERLIVRRDYVAWRPCRDGRKRRIVGTPIATQQARPQLCRQ